jgi:hypothetical protein
MKTVEVENSGKAIRTFHENSREGLVRVTDHGKLVAYILPASIYDEEDIGYMTDPGFWKMIAERRASDEGVSLEKVVKRLEAREKRERMATRRGKASKRVR